jgi:hypothetical protein
MDRLTAGLERDNPEREHKNPKPAHKLTPEERRRGGLTALAKLREAGKAHKFTREDCREGALKVALRIRTGKLPPTSRHTLTQEDRRKAGLATAAKRKAQGILRATVERFGRSGAPGVSTSPSLMPRVQRAAALPPEPSSSRGILDPSYFADPGEVFESLKGEPAQRGSDSSGGPALGPHERISADKLREGTEPAPECLTTTTPAPDVFAVDVKAMAEKLRSIPYAEVEVETKAIAALLDGSLPPDPLTLSALKRFRLGPLSPLALTRSQRAHLPILQAGGWIEADAQNMMRLTAKGEAALKVSREDAA